MQVKQFEDTSVMSKKNIEGMDKVLKNLKDELEQALAKNRTFKEEI